MASKNYFVLTILFTLSTAFSLLWAQNPIEIQGQVVESTKNQPIEFATILIADSKTNTSITGTTTDSEGNFLIKTKATDFYVEISFIGYFKKTIRDFVNLDGVLDLGIIILSESSQTLDEVVVRADKSSTEFKLDKRVFNVGKDLSSTGASALEVLNNVPSVNVNIEGEISLRGSTGFQILLNGKPSVIASEQGNALGTITADMIEKIEVITNPSAKYDAEGTSGIINIVIKKEDKKGINGSATLNTGIPHNHSFGLSLNRRTEKFNLFSQFGIGYRELPNENENINQDLIRQTKILSQGKEYRNETFYNLILGTDYHINPYNVLTLSGHFAYEVEDQPSNTNFRFLDNTEERLSEWYRDETTTATNPKYEFELQYKKDFKDNKDHMLLFSALGDFFGKDQSSEFENIPIFGAAEFEKQQTRTDYKFANYTFKLDYTHPFQDKFTLETGAQYVINDVENDYGVLDYDDGIWIENTNLTNIFEFNQGVLGLYSTGAYENDSWGLKLGLRLENTDLSTFLINTQETNKQNYTNLFPSIHTSYKLTKKLSLQAGYSRRIYRPRTRELNPFSNIRNNFSIRQGNPDLQPEFTDSYEITSIAVFGTTSLNFGIYHRYTTDVIERVTSFNNNISTTFPLNIGTNRTTGIEFNAKINPAKWLSVNGDFNYLYFNRQGSFESASFDFEDNQWFTRLTGKMKLPADIEMELTGQYHSGYQTVQSEISDNLYMDLGIRKKIMNGKTVFNLSIRDVFASRIRESETKQPNFYLYNRRQSGRFISFGISYGFGKGEAMEFSGQKRRR